jgi:hypothetical protein
MKGRPHTQTQAVAGSCLATSSQAPRATLTLAAKASYPRAPHPTRSGSLLDTPGALLEGLRCSPASRPLPTPTHAQGGTPFITLHRPRRVQ